MDDGAEDVVKWIGLDWTGPGWIGLTELDWIDGLIDR